MISETRIKIDILKALNEPSKEETIKKLEELAEEIKIAYYFEGANDVSRQNYKRRKEAEKQIQESNKIISITSWKNFLSKKIKGNKS